MARENNFLLGHGERLTFNVDVQHNGGPKNPPYDNHMAVKRISHFLSSANQYFSSLPEIACPDGEVTAVVTMHPRYIAKSDFPSKLIQHVGLRAVGGKTEVISPEAWGIKVHPNEAISDEIFVIGKKSAYLNWSAVINKWLPVNTMLQYLPKIEKIRPYIENDKITFNVNQNNDTILLEVVLHNSDKLNIVDLFTNYVGILKGIIVKEKIRKVQNLIFVPVYIENNNVLNLAKFTFIRLIRKMPILRTMAPFQRSKTSKIVKLPISTSAIDQKLRVAIFDGGLSDNINLPWVNIINPIGIGDSLPDAENHGTDVTSAFLFGPIDTNNDIHAPYCNVDNVRVVDNNIGQNGDFMYYDVLDRILKIIDDAKNNENPYEYINLSIGPDIPIDDSDVTRWTAELDKRLSGGEMLACVAVGNNGEEDDKLKLNRIQPPSDGVNVLAVGAADSDNEMWSRASYSCIGPGRCPGYIKPDGIAFGGTEGRPFLTLSNNVSTDSYCVTGTMGTSFASPYTLRCATGIKVMIGDDFLPLTVKALMIHRADKSNYDKREVGWGKFEKDIEKLITCDDDEALVVYQGMLPIKETLRVPIPMPDEALEGMVTITATLAIAPEVDASFPNTYTRAGLTVAFRPNCIKFNENEGKTSKHPKTKSFFTESTINNSAEYILRTENHKWETCLKETKNYFAKTLNKPCFDLYYNNRIEGAKDDNAESIPYAFIVSIKAPKVNDLYNKTLRAYLNQLVPLKPKTRIKIKVKE